MNQGIRLFIYPVKDIARAKTLYSKLLGIEPYLDEAYYVGFRVGDQEIGLDPNGHSNGMTAPVGYWLVDDIKKSLQILLDAGAQTQHEVKDVGGGKLIASVKDADSNIIGLFSHLNCTKDKCTRFTRLDTFDRRFERWTRRRGRVRRERRMHGSK
jgi:predicted enzyme related to lactoylglutathione lyase